MKNVLVFPCGSEIGLEIYRSLCYSPHIKLIGASSVDDHGKFIYTNYIGGLPFIESPKIINYLKKIIKAYQVDAIYPTMDKVIWKLKSHEKELGCKIISSPKETTEVCLSKFKTYNRLNGVVRIPKTYQNIKKIVFPVFIKSNIGYGSRDVFKAEQIEDLKYFFSKKDISDYVISEFLTGKEYTIDCFTDRHHQLRFCGPRIRQRISNGISVNTKPVIQNYKDFYNIAKAINNELEMQGAWFFQLKKDKSGNLALMEVAARLGGSSSLYRGKGINFALLSVYDAFNIEIEIIENNYKVELDRALDNKYKINLEFSNVYVDLDDTLIINNKVNAHLLAFLYQCFNNGKKIILITKYKYNLRFALRKYRILSIFDKIIHISDTEEKFKFIRRKKSIFIDDSFAERKKVLKNKKIPVFSLDTINLLLK